MEAKVRSLHKILAAVCGITAVLVASDDIVFEDFFVNATMRIDYCHIGNSTTEMITLDRVYREKEWAGNPRSLIDPIGQGRYLVRVKDPASGMVIFTRGYDSYFAEYQTTGPAKAGVRRTYHESVLIPYPKDTIQVIIERRQRDQTLQPIFEQIIDPASYSIITEMPGRNCTIIPSVYNGSYADHVDVVVISEGYTAADSSKFRQDLQKFSDVFFAWEPYKSTQDQFNFTGIFIPSLDTGVDEPRRGLFKRTVLNATFNSLDSERYLLTEDNKSLRDIACQVPYDLILIMVNINRYGGGGIYNQFCTFTSDGPWNEHVFHHEIGHAFGGLADEYYTSDVAYEEFYPRGIEPLEPNVTALLDPSQVKWQIYLDPDIPVPTPWGREKFDKLLSDYQMVSEHKEEEIKLLRDSNASQAEFDSLEEKYARLRTQAWKNIDNFFELHPLKGKVGVYEGAAYMPDGFYRPTVNSIMHRFSKSEKKFYPVNEAALKQMIAYYTE